MTSRDIHFYLARETRKEVVGSTLIRKFYFATYGEGIFPYLMMERTNILYDEWELVCLVGKRRIPSARDDSRDDFLWDVKSQGWRYGYGGRPAVRVYEYGEEVAALT